MIFLKGWINGEQEEKKISESELSFASNWRLKSGAFGSRPRKQKPGNELRNADSCNVKGGSVPAGLSSRATIPFLAILASFCVLKKSRFYQTRSKILTDFVALLC